MRMIDDLEHEERNCSVVRELLVINLGTLSLVVLYCEFIPQDYFGETMCDTNSARGLLYMVADALDRVTNNNDWSLYQDLKFIARLVGNMIKMNSFLICFVWKSTLSCSCFRLYLMYTKQCLFTLSMLKSE